MSKYYISNSARYTRESTRSGASARSGDRVRNLTTGEERTVAGATNSGRLILVGTSQLWERWGCQVVV